MDYFADYQTFQIDDISTPKNKNEHKESITFLTCVKPTLEFNKDWHPAKFHTTPFIATIMMQICPELSAKYFVTYSLNRLHSLRFSRRSDRIEFIFVETGSFSKSAVIIIKNDSGFALYGSKIGDARPNFLQDTLDSLVPKISISDIYFNKVSKASLSVHEACCQIMDLIQNCPGYKIEFCLPEFGCEDLLITLAQSYGIKVKVNGVREFLFEMLGMQRFFVHDTIATKIHVISNTERSSDEIKIQYKEHKVVTMKIGYVFKPATNWKKTGLFMLPWSDKISQQVYDHLKWSLLPFKRKTSNEEFNNPRPLVSIDLHNDSSPVREEDLNASRVPATPQQSATSVHTSLKHSTNKSLESPEISCANDLDLSLIDDELEKIRCPLSQQPDFVPQDDTQLEIEDIKPCITILHTQLGLNESQDMIGVTNSVKNNPSSSNLGKQTREENHKAISSTVVDIENPTKSLKTSNKRKNSLSTIQEGGRSADINQERPRVTEESKPKSKKKRLAPKYTSEDYQKLFN